LHVSKEIARQFYRKTKWHNDVEEAKKTAQTKGIKDWKAVCKSQPPKLDPQIRTIISEIYMASANALTSRRLFDVPELENVVEEYSEYADEN
jgi:phosphoribosylaminoimidazole-succinocarboxamide synthase